jgi:hypothetical protein
VVLGLLELQQALLKAPQILVAVVEAERKHLRRVLMEKQAVPVSSFSRSTSHENLSTHGH